MSAYVGLHEATGPMTMLICRSSPLEDIRRNIPYHALHWGRFARELSRPIYVERRVRHERRCHLDDRVASETERVDL